MQAGVAFIVQIRVLQQLFVVLYNACDEEDVVEKDGSPQASRGIDPTVSSSVKASWGRQGEVS